MQQLIGYGGRQEVKAAARRLNMDHLCIFSLAW